MDDVIPLPTDLPQVTGLLASRGRSGHAWAAGMWQQDPLADAVVNDTDSAAGRAVRTALRDGIGDLDALPASFPASARALLTQVSTAPEWLERDRLDRAADVLVRYTAQWGLVLGAASLLRGADNRVAAMPLVLTGRYGNEPAVRSIEVGAWLQQITRRGGMEVDGPGFQHTVRVRMIHAHVRRHVGALPDWDEARWGVPVPQSYMAFTLAEFGHVSLAAMERLGARLRPDELADVYHLWRYVGHLIGVEEALNPVDEADHVRIEEFYSLTSPGPDEHSKAFCRALTEQYLAPQLAAMLPGPDAWRQKFALSTMYGMSRIFLGQQAADALDVPDGVAKFVLRAARPLLLGLDQTRLLIQGRDGATRRGYVARDRELARLRAEQEMTHDLVDSVPGAVGHQG
ncbi:oxygenase MpaB family protein [Nocardioides yefusunii]|uniref:Oxygenase MpaB family protein n=1 Tax=Nocardioides yefusunii TaxID=2500546 RepID=A0ABW1QU80_9ACTN|nr:oxygenase MpaB family protein [Nocardioides yefusunii]